MRQFYCVLWVLIILSCSPQQPLTAQKNQQIQKIAFGSCNKQYKPQPLWDKILEQKPDLWIWLGDIIYADTKNMEDMRSKYEQQSKRKSYKKFVQQVPIIGIWDDHDYGENNAGKEYSQKQQSQQILLDFLGEPKDSPRRKRLGAYASYEYGEAPKQIKVILLDARYHRDEPSPEGDILGEEQWQWLEQQLSQSKAAIHVICSGIQIVSNKHRYEKWNNFPKSRTKLFSLIKKHKTPGVIFLSGDRHFTELSMTNEVGYPLYDLTSSGMTHCANLTPEQIANEPNPHLVSARCNELNFGMLWIDWENSKITIRSYSKENKVLIEKAIPLSELKFK